MVLMDNGSMGNGFCGAGRLVICERTGPLPGGGSGMVMRQIRFWLRVDRESAKRRRVGQDLLEDVGEVVQMGP
jgi:hypothetical protein